MARTPLSGPGLAGERELADDGIRTGPVEGDLSAAQEQAQGDGQVEAAGVLLQVGRGQVDDHPVDRAAITRVDDRALDPVRALPDGGLRQAHQYGLGLDENETSTSTSTGVASIPTSVYEASLASIEHHCPRREPRRSRAMNPRAARYAPGERVKVYHGLMD